MGMNACYMRHIGVSENECLGHCDRNSQSGCELIVNDVTFSLCWNNKNNRGRKCNIDLRPSECELGCRSYPDGPSPHQLLKADVKTAFDEMMSSSPERKMVLPALIRKAFHDAGHFDRTNGEVRMGCIQHFLSGNNKCTQHGHLEKADDFVKAVLSKVTPNMVLSVADAVQLLGALAVDELAKGTGALSLYDRVRTGRVDPTAETCIKEKEMCENLPAFSTKKHSAEHESIVDSLEDVFKKEVRGKMMRVNSFTKKDAVALIGAHTVGRHFLFGHWTQQPFIFDNEYFVHLNRVKDWLDQGNTFGRGDEVPFGKRVFPTWFMDDKEVEDPDAPLGGFNFKNIMMLDADLTLVLNAGNLIERYANNGKLWRRDFDNAYVKMGELGFVSLDPPLDGENRRLLQSEELLDEDFEFFQNLRILQEEQMEKIHGAFRKF